MTDSLTTNLLTGVRSDIKSYLETVLTHFAAGTDDTAPDPSDTTLGAEVFRDTIDEFDDSEIDSITASGRIFTTEANGNTIAEFGWLNAASGGTLWERSTPNSVAKIDSINLFHDMTITITVEEV